MLDNFVTFSKAPLAFHSRFFYSGVNGTFNHEKAASLVEGKLSFQTQVDGHMSIYMGLESSGNILAFNGIHVSYESKLSRYLFLFTCFIGKSSRKSVCH